MLVDRPRRHPYWRLTSDMLVMCGSWFAAYWLRFNSELMASPKGIPDITTYVYLVPVLLLVYFFSYRAQELYEERSTLSEAAIVWRSAKANLLALVLSWAIAAFIAPAVFSRSAFVIFGSICFVFQIPLAILLARIESRAYRRGKGLGPALIVGAGELGQRLAASLQKHPGLGLRPVGFLTRNPDKIGETIVGLPVLGMEKDVIEAVNESRAGTVFVALPLDAQRSMIETLNLLTDSVAEVVLVPDLMRLVQFAGTVDTLDGLPLLNIQKSPLAGFNRLLKRAFDIAFSLAVLVFGFPVFLGIAICVKLSSPGPIFYGQERMGLDGQVFKIWKFRSMRVDAEARTGAVWATKDDDRRTAFGTFLREKNLDELPQFFNALVGDMSIVGPRPERPVFIEQFRKEIPRYMLRHTVKAGVTGWAAVNGLRGDTSLKDRIDYDLYYIANWSFLFDIRVILMTVFRGFSDPNAY